MLERVGNAMSHFVILVEFEYETVGILITTVPVGYDDRFPVVPVWLRTGRLTPVRWFPACVNQITYCRLH